MNILEAIILAVIQGITEWLPISSSAHLAIFQNLFKLEENIQYDALLHFASMLVIILVFYKDIIAALKNKKYIIYLILATFPIIIVGLFIEPYIQAIFNNLLIVGICLIITGILLFISKEINKKDINLKNSFIIGLTQAVAILPGISRSGSTLCAGLLQGIKKEEAIKFSFLLGIPALLGAFVLKFKDIQASIDANMIIGSIITIIVGYFSLNFLISIVKKNRLMYFSYYCFALALLAITLSFL